MKKKRAGKSDEDENSDDESILRTRKPTRKPKKKRRVEKKEIVPRRSSARSVKSKINYDDNVYITDDDEEDEEDQEDQDETHVEKHVVLRKKKITKTNTFLLDTEEKPDFEKDYAALVEKHGKEKIFTKVETDEQNLPLEEQILTAEQQEINERIIEDSVTSLKKIKGEDNFFGNKILATKMQKWGFRHKTEVFGIETNDLWKDPNSNIFGIKSDILEILNLMNDDFRDFSKSWLESSFYKFLGKYQINSDYDEWHYFFSGLRSINKNLGDYSVNYKGSELKYTVNVSSKLFEGIFNLLNIPYDCNVRFNMKTKYREQKLQPSRSDAQCFAEVGSPFVTTYVEIKPSVKFKLSDFEDLEKSLFESRCSFDHSMENDDEEELNRYVLSVIASHSFAFLSVSNIVPNPDDATFFSHYDMAWLPRFDLKNPEDLAKIISLLIVHLKRIDLPDLSANKSIKKVPGSGNKTLSDLQSLKKKLNTLNNNHSYSNIKSLENYNNTKNCLFTADMTQRRENHVTKTIIKLCIEKDTEMECKSMELCVLESMKDNSGVPIIFDYTKQDTYYMYSMERLFPFRFINNGKNNILSLLTKNMKQILETMYHLHKLDYAHKDIKTSNVMLRQSNNDAILIDYDLAVKMQQGEFIREDKILIDEEYDPSGTTGYIAPELYKEQIYSTKVDVFSAGIMFAEWLFNNDFYQFERESHIHVNSAILKKKRELKEDAIEFGLLTLIEGMVSVRPEDRPTSKQALQQLDFVVAGKRNIKKQNVRKITC